MTTSPDPTFDDIYGADASAAFGLTVPTRSRYEDEDAVSELIGSYLRAELPDEKDDDWVLCGGRDMRSLNPPPSRRGGAALDASPKHAQPEHAPPKHAKDESPERGSCAPPPSAADLSKITRFPEWAVRTSRAPGFQGADYGLLWATPSAHYECLAPIQVARVREAFHAILRAEDMAEDRKTVVDATAGVGCDAINFVLMSGRTSHVVAVENDATTFEALKRNVAAVEMAGHITPVFADANKYLEKAAENVGLVYFDPPWGGPEYKHSELLQLSLGGRPVCEAVNAAINHVAPLVILKAPPNFDFIGFGRSLVGGTAIARHPIRLPPPPIKNRAAGRSPAGGVNSVGGGVCEALTPHTGPRLDADRVIFYLIEIRRGVPIYPGAAYRSFVPSWNGRPALDARALGNIGAHLGVKYLPPHRR